MSNLPVEQLRQLKVGDVVTIEKDIFGGRPKLVTAPIIKIEKRWGSNALPMITLEGHDPNWLGKAGEGPFFDRCFEQGAHMVVRVDKIGHYKVQSKSARNAFEEHMDNQSERPWLNPRDEQPKGVLYGHYGNMDFLFIYALSKLNYDFDDRAYSPEKARMCWEKAGRPGFIRQPEPEKVGGRKDF